MWAQLHVRTQLRQPLHAWTLPQLTRLLLSPQWPWDVNEDPQEAPTLLLSRAYTHRFWWLCAAGAAAQHCALPSIHPSIQPAIHPSIHPPIHRYSSSQRSPLSSLLDIIQSIQLHMRHGSLIHTAQERVNTPPFGDDLLPLQQDISSFEYLRRGGGQPLAHTCIFRSHLIKQQCPHMHVTHRNHLRTKCVQSVRNRMWDSSVSDRRPAFFFPSSFFFFFFFCRFKRDSTSKPAKQPSIYPSLPLHSIIYMTVCPPTTTTTGLPQRRTGSATHFQTSGQPTHPIHKSWHVAEPEPRILSDRLPTLSQFPKKKKKKKKKT